MTKGIAFQAKIDLHEGMVPPDVWMSAAGLIPPHDFIVSRNRDGSIASRYGDEKWDRTPYQIDGRTTWLYFTSWCDEHPTSAQISLSYEIRYFLFILIWKRPGAPLGNSSLDNYMQLLKRLAEHAENNNCSLRDALANKDLLSNFCKSSIRASAFPYLNSFLNLLLRLGEQEIGFKPLGLDFQRTLKGYVAQYRDGQKQFSPIPTRIYSIILANLKRELDEWEDVEERYLGLLSDCLSNPLFGKSEHTQITIGTKTGIERTPGEYFPGFQELVRERGLEKYFNDRDLQYSVHGMSRGLSFVMTVAKIYVVALSGMRNKEASNLPFHCLDTELDSGGVTHCLVVGLTTKLKRVATRWVTNGEGHKAIKIAQRIAKLIYKRIGVIPSSNKKERNLYSLFVSTAYLGFVARPPKGQEGVWKSTGFSLHRKSFQVLRDRLQPKIEENDIKELEYIDPHRNWRGEDDFRVGKQWGLTEHQLRRSLALYAQRSGYVSLPSLRRQLQHITEEMSRYYARGSVFAKNFIGDDKDHFGWDWQEAVPISAGLAYIRDVLFANEPVFGGHIKWIDHRLKSGDSLIFMDRDVTIKRFKKGELAYKETPIGGCTKVGPCDELAIRFLDVDCISGCVNLVGKLSKLERVINAQSSLVSKLSPNTIEWRMENSDLEVLVATRDKIVQSQAKE